jgi:hypothetical protein
VQRTVEFGIKQTNRPGTVVHLKHVYNVQTFDGFEVESWENRFGPQRSEVVERVKRDVEKIVKDIGDFKARLQKLAVWRPAIRTEWDERGMSCVMYRGTGMKWSKAGEDVRVEKRTALCEGYYVSSPVTPDDYDGGVVEVVGKEHRQEKVRLVRKEVQGLLEHVTATTPA